MPALVAPRAGFGPAADRRCWDWPRAATGATFGAVSMALGARATVVTLQLFNQLPELIGSRSKV